MSTAAAPLSRQMDFSEIPIIDIGPLVRGEAGKEREVIAQIDAALSNIGFMYIKNHGVPQDTRDRLAKQARAFFALPQDQRMEVYLAKSPQFRGYLPRGYSGENSRSEGLQEGFFMMPERAVNPEVPLDGPNQWPSALPELRPAMEAYHAAAAKLGRVLISALAQGLGKPEDFFDPMYTSPVLTLKLNHYLPQDSDGPTADVDLDGHTDSGNVTILWQDDVGGLEVRNKKGEWVAAPPIPDTYVINIGDAMNVWSNKHFASTTHRVVYPHSGDRLSIAFFANPNYWSLVKPLIGEMPADFKPFYTGEHSRGIYRKNYPQLKQAG